MQDSEGFTLDNAMILFAVVQILLSIAMFNSLKSSYIHRTFRRFNHLSSAKDDHIFRFGVIADIQYVDADDAFNFQKTKVRHYRNSLETYRKAVLYWNNMITQQSDHSFVCSIVLGDILDGKTAALKSQEKCYIDFKAIADSFMRDTLYCFGNHCHYSFSRTELVTKFLSSIPKYNSHVLGKSCNPGKIYYDWSPHPG